MDGAERGLDPGEPLQQDPAAPGDEERADHGIERLPVSLDNNHSRPCQEISDGDTCLVSPTICPVATVAPAAAG